MGIELFEVLEITMNAASGEIIEDEREGFLVRVKVVGIVKLKSTFFPLFVSVLLTAVK